MSPYPRFKVFSVTFGVLYVLAFYMNSLDPLSQWWAPFRYYPAVAEWHIERQPPETAGPAILWYAWMAEAFVAAVVVSLLTPRKLADRVSATALWAVPAVVIGAILVYERRWFF